MSIYGNPVMLGGSGGGGGGGSTNVLFGTTTPTAAQGNNGAMYLKYSTLPSGYSSVEYIEASGSQYIDTGVIGTGATEIEFDISIVSSVSAWRVLMGAYTANVKNSFGVFLNGLTTISYQRGNNVYQDQSYSITIGNRYVFRTDKEKLYINDVNTHTLSGYAVTTPVNLYLSAVNANGTASDFAPPHKLYGAKIWEAGDLIRCFSPCVRTADNIPGLYDMVNGQFYHSGGSNEYSAGSPTTAESPVVAAYAKVSGAWQDLIGTDINDIDLGS